jgi:hypothetical protein
MVSFDWVQEIWQTGKTVRPRSGLTVNKVRLNSHCYALTEMVGPTGSALALDGSIS